MYTYIVKTKSPRGPRSSISETFVIVEMKSEAHARCQAIAAAHPGATVTSVELVGSIKRVHVGS